MTTGETVKRRRTTPAPPTPPAPPARPPIKLTETACPRCLKLAQEGRLRPETIQRLPEGAMAPLARDGSGKCCFDCAAAEGLMRRLGILDFYQARVATANDRQEQYRLPGAPMGLVLEGITRPSAPGDFDEQLAWLDRHDWFGLAEDEL